MSNFIKKQTVTSWILCGAIVTGIIAFIIFLVNSTTGYYQGTTIDPLTLTFSILYLVGAIALFACKDLIQKCGKWASWIETAAYIVLALFISLAIVFLISSRTELTGDVYFIPGMSTDAKESTLNLSFVCLAFYIVSFICLAVCGFRNNLAAPSHEEAHEEA